MKDTTRSFPNCYFHILTIVSKVNKSNMNYKHILYFKIKLNSQISNDREQLSEIHTIIYPGCESNSQFANLKPTI